jgi:hypothetical protein
MTDYRELFKNQIGACATCKQVRTVIKTGDTIRDEDILVTYDGSKHARCAKKSSTHIVMRDKPNMDLPLSDCWEPV